MGGVRLAVFGGGGLAVAFRDLFHDFRRVVTLLLLLHLPLFHHGMGGFLFGFVLSLVA